MADARKLLTTSNTEIQGQLTVGEMIALRVQFQEAKRQANISGVFSKAVEELHDAEVEDHEPDHDWTARFFNHVQDVSSEEMQLLWAKVLAGEVERPGSTSTRTLSILRDLNKETADLFGKLCYICLGLDSDEDIVALDVNCHPASPRLGLGVFGLGKSKLNNLNEHGLIHPGYSSEFSVRLGRRAWAKSRRACTRLRFQGRTWLLEVMEKQDEEYTGHPHTSLEFPDEEGGDYILRGQYGVLLTKAGRELAKLVDQESISEYASKLRMHFRFHGLRMITLVD